jgi:hypothetical protein
MILLLVKRLGRTYGLVPIKRSEEYMPTPFMCHGCDKPTMNKNGVCDDCVKKENEKKRSRR